VEVFRQCGLKLAPRLVFLTFLEQCGAQMISEPGIFRFLIDQIVEDLDGDIGLASGFRSRRLSSRSMR
jgi:hypothetical protein